MWMETILLCLLGFGLVLIIALHFAMRYLFRCIVTIMTEMPLGTWVPFDEVMKFGYPEVVTAAVLEKFIEQKLMSFRRSDELSTLREVLMLPIEDTGENPEFNRELASCYDYMLHRRPRFRKRKLLSFKFAPEESGVPAHA